MAVAKIDNKRRITLKEARPGEVYDVEYIGGGHYRLRRMRVEPDPTEEVKREDAETQSEG